MVATQVGLAGLGMVPGAGPFVGAVDPAQVALGADRVRSVFAARFRNRDDAHLVLSPLQVLTPLFVRAVEEATQRAGRVVLFFDTYEYTGTFLDTWLRDVLIEARYGELPVGVMVVTSGQSRLSPAVWGDHLDLVHELELEVFTEAEARQLLGAKGIQDEQVIEVILRLSGRLPVLVHLLAESRPASVEDVGDPSGTAIERFLRWESAPARRAAALACALPLELDEDICRLLTGEEGGAEVFDWLRRRPFVTDRSGRCRYHDVVRDAMLRLQRAQSPQRWERLHILLADTCARRRLREEQGDDRTPRQWWQEQWWRECRLRETYHRLCAHPHRALPAALAELLHAYAHSPVTLRRWAQTLYRAGRDADAPALSQWGEEVLAALESPQEGIAGVLSRLLADGKLDSGDRALAHALRGREHHDVRDVEPALADYTAALDLDPHLVRAHVGRAWMQMWQGCSDDALAGFARAIELEPHQADAYQFRGTTYTVMGRYGDALADYTRAIELAPGAIVPRSNRGGLYMRMGRYEEALTDYHRAIALAPDSSSSHSARGRVYARSGRFEEALADHDHAVELDAHDVWAYAMRGEAYRYLGRFEEACTDFDRAIELGPDYSLLYVGRGETHRLQGHYEAALADLHRAVELAPDDGWTKLHRGRLHRLAGRYDDALGDLLPQGRPGPTEAWRRYEIALVRRVTNQSDWEEELVRSERLYRDLCVGGFTGRTGESAMLFIIRCALQDWTKAGQTLESILRAGPAAHRLRQTMDDLEEAVAVFRLPSEPVRLLRRKLGRQASSSPSTMPGGPRP
ncbi:tetratricopeptide repeat protein [Streptomyces monomycini]|uniref:tetratricopeptide repeat protein n=1 Tax=Streptomyces monomycini TaxID=371720 RepID=UPI001EEC41FC|nr:tetratricopeptide repeat protein [Streptomyces monomycini]